MMIRLSLALIALVAFAAPDEATPPGRLRRLTHSQYNNTVRDLLGDQTRPADQFPPEDFLNGFKNQSRAQEISPILAEAYNTAAERLARNAFAGGEDSNHLIPCTPKSAGDSACATAFVRSFGGKAFRRPLSEAEAKRYTALLLRENQFLRGAQLVVEAMLQSPKFLFRLETVGYKAASDLSYFLWDTMPDDELFRAATAGELTTEAGVRRQAARLLKDPKAKQALDEFTSQWLRFDQVWNTVKDRALYPQFNLQLAAAMTEETRRLVAELVWSEKNFMDLFRADYAFLNSDLAVLYGLPAPANEFEKVKFPVDSPRAGVLGEAAFLAMTSKPGETSPTVRGLFVRDQFLCQQVPDPPPGVNSTLPPVTVEKPQTNRQRLQEHVINKACAGCHMMMDPIGFGFEKFDAIGQWHDKQMILVMPGHGDRKSKPVKLYLDIDPSASVSGVRGSEFASPKELGRILGESPVCQECMVKQLFRYAFGRRETSADGPLIQRGLDVFRKSGFHWKDLMVFYATAQGAD
jgi:Protein of unknown function (DUF1592)/Protein of unknown function (DUF1588)/Protein of unknown function (DUF1587)/Protein of unknown function (DUF1595)/Protein of unknown function (DUF1585)